MLIAMLFTIVEFAGKAFTLTSDERTWVEDMMLTAFHRTTDIIP